VPGTIGTTAEAISSRSEGSSIPSQQSRKRAVENVIPRLSRAAANDAFSAGNHIPEHRSATDASTASSIVDEPGSSGGRAQDRAGSLVGAPSVRAFAASSEYTGNAR